MRKAHLATATTFLALTAGVVASPASSAVLDHRHFHDADSEPFTFCKGMNAEVAWDDHIHELVTAGKDGLVHFSANVRGTTTFTNLDTGGTMIRRYAFHDRDLRVTDNGDGTLTILVLATGNAVLYGMDGKAIARDPGQVRFELLVDHNGTPSDPTDDEILAFLGLVKESTGRSDDFCAAAVAALS